MHMVMLQLCALDSRCWHMHVAVLGALQAVHGMLKQHQAEITCWRVMHHLEDDARLDADLDMAVLDMAKLA